MRMLIVDDEEIIRRGLAMLDWASVGIDQVETAENGVEARELLRAHNIDIVVSDIKMPGLSGLELAEYVAACTRHTRVILLTGFSDFAYAQSAIKSGVSDYLLKPVKPQELLDAVGHALKGLRLDVKTERIVREYSEQGSSLSLQQQVLQGFRGVGDGVAAILQYMAANYADSISLGSLAREYHFSSMHISRMIKKETGYSFVDILTGIRLVSAAKLLREENSRVNAVCDRSGWSDQRYFSQVFKKVFGRTPLEYRRQPQEVKEYALLELLELMNRDK